MSNNEELVGSLNRFAGKSISRVRIIFEGAELGSRLGYAGALRIMHGGAGRWLRIQVMAELSKVATSDDREWILQQVTSQLPRNLHWIYIDALNAPYVRSAEDADLLVDIISGVNYTTYARRSALEGLQYRVEESEDESLLKQFRSAVWHSITSKSSVLVVSALQCILYADLTGLEPYVVEASRSKMWSASGEIMELARAVIFKWQ
jgi:hypothetical protein